MAPSLVVFVVPLATFVDMSTNISIPAAFIQNYQGGKPTTNPKGKKTSSASKHFKHHHAVKASRTSLPAPAYKAHHTKDTTKVTVTAVPQKWAAGHLEGTTKVLLHRTPEEEVTLSPTSSSTVPKAVYKGTHLGGTRVRLTPSQVPSIFLAPSALPATLEWSAAHLGGTKVLLQRPGPPMVKAEEKMDEKPFAHATQAPERWAASHVGGTRLRLSRTAL
ncbi:hypothetical protein L202_02007 [Cryptococcus amylolentus CBS 6039]|uniref:Uncharacterized protein n=1 Tax=Cryptococcus amylolentus CBS 6039 TaxID=1295533 RepID=A0A1E3HZL7_9TREE|nr:hypothetical protein L202_02007 [Cryptococcus amylolentus CBS 6039]ODN81595.1 hypothetical protein L202_02007 [Cryptococcus amylolentus CBS 6039]